MKKKVIVLVLLAAVAGGGYLLYRYTDRKGVIKKIRAKYGAANPHLMSSDKPFEGQSMATLRRWLATGGPSWMGTNTAGWQYR